MIILEPYTLFGMLIRDSRYENNDYKGFKTAVHEALHPGDDAPPLPRASKWFPQDRINTSNTLSRRQGEGSHDANGEDSEESDEEIYISRTKTDFKCPLSLQRFQEPYTNKICKHTYEKRYIIEYINEQGLFFTQNHTTGEKSKEKQVQCVQVGCDKVISRTHKVAIASTKLL